LDHAVYEVHPLPFQPGRFSNAYPCEKQQNEKRLPEIIQDFEKTPD
jgi:hypothetical protein